MNYTTCRQEISRLISPTKPERIQLDKSFGRVVADDIVAIVPQPEFRQSLRDGYVLTSFELGSATELIFSVKGMIQAGSTAVHNIETGTVCRIMTGGMVPKNGVRIIPQEDCVSDGSTLQISANILCSNNTFIQEQGCNIAAGDIMVSRGTVLATEQIGLLASVGCMELGLYQRPKVAFLCSGSELVDSPKELHPGLKISSNHHLLYTLIKQHGADPVYLGTIEDSADAMTKVFNQIQDGEYDMVISTGGMGPGKYDLIEQTFIASGGKVLYNRLNLRPGKASLCGTIDKTLFFGLPGPPTAVNALMNAIVGPALMQMQGVQQLYPRVIQAYLEQPLSIKRSGVMQLRGGVISFNKGCCMVRESAGLEPSTCYLVLDAQKSGYDRGELIDVHLKSGPFNAPY